MKRKLLFVLLGLTLVISLLFGACAAPAPAPPAAAPAPVAPTPAPAPPEKVEVIELSWATPMPPTGFYSEELFPEYAKLVSDATKGRIKLTHYPAQTLIKMMVALDALKSGVAHISMMAPYEHRALFKIVSGCDLGWYCYNTPVVASRVVQNVFNHFKPKAWDEAGLKPLHFFCNGPHQLMTKIPIRKVEDLKGVEIRTSGYSTDSMAALGAVPVALPIVELYLALEKGVVQGEVNPIESLQTFKTGELQKYITIVPFIHCPALMHVMNLDKWNSLPADIQQAWEKVDEEQPERCGSYWDKASASALKWVQEEHGIELIYLSPEEEARWRELLKPIVDKWIAERTAEGVPAQEVSDFIVEQTEIYNAKYPVPDYFPEHYKH